MKLNIHPDYKLMENISITDSQNLLRKCIVPDSIQISYGYVKGLENDHDIKICTYTPKNAGVELLPVIMDIHGGGFSSGDLLMDRNRDIYLSQNVPATVISLNYRLNQAYPAALNDCRSVWQWIFNNSESLHLQSSKMGLFGASAGGNLCAALAFYIRDNGGPKISLNALMMPTLNIGTSTSKDQMRFGAPVLNDSKGRNIYAKYLGSCGGTFPSYYAVPGVALDYTGLPSTLVVAAEYDPLRDDACKYAKNLMESDVPTEFYIMPRVGHGFDMVWDAPMTKWIWQGIALSFKREFYIPTNKQQVPV